MKKLLLAGIALTALNTFGMKDSENSDENPELRNDIVVHAYKEWVGGVLRREETYDNDRFGKRKSAVVVIYDKNGNLDTKKVYKYKEGV